MREHQGDADQSRGKSGNGSHHEIVPRFRVLEDMAMTKLAGVIDFDTTSLGDPAWDLATQLHCGIEFAQLVFHAYGRIEKLRVVGVLGRMRDA